MDDPDRDPPPPPGTPPATMRPGLTETLGRIAARHGWSDACFDEVLTAVEASVISTTGPRADLAPLPHAPPIADADRYRWLEHLARGGQGDVWLVRDARLDRDLVIKVLRPGGSSAEREAMRLECAITVALSHPGIVPVFDRGETLDGRPWFAMKRVEGVSLGAIIDGVHRRPTPRWTLRRLIDLLGRICDAVAYAHQQGVVHCDLKPANIMVGPFGEALVMDWGIARRMGNPAPMRGSGRPAGTPGYIPPERETDPATLDPAIDVYALGAILLRILVGLSPPRATDVPALLTDRRWVDGRPIPAELADLCRRAMHPDPAERLAGAAAFGAALVDWLDGARQREQALELVERARAIGERLAHARDEVEALRARAADALDGVQPHEPAERKRAGWRLADTARDKAEALALEELAFEQTLRAALTRVPDLPEAHAALAAHYRAALARAERDRDRGAARRYAELLRAHDDGTHAEWLAGDGALTLVCDPPDARVTLARYVMRDRRLEPVDPIDLGRGPIERRTLARGSYLATLEAPGHESVRYPVHLERGEHWHGCPPDSDRPYPIRLPRRGELAPGEIYVPAGWARFGGDPEAVDPLPARRLWVDGFAIAVHSVTHAAYMAFLQRLVDAGRTDEALRLMPWRRGGSSDADDGLYRLGPDGRLEFGISEDDDPIEPDGAVVLVDWFQACAFAADEARRTGRDLRLPHDLEWEKAARGVDGRRMPWGDFLDPSWTRVLESFPGRPRPSPVCDAPEDISPYGVRDVVGCVRNWCAADYTRLGPEGDRVLLTPPTGPYRAVRGGHWCSVAAYCRPASRFANRPDQRFRAIGLRLARSFG